MMNKGPFELTPIARIHSPYKDKFGIPRQSRLTNAARGIIELLSPYNRPEALDGLDAFSHLWLLWLFDRNPAQQAFKPSVRPPRLGGNTRRGVFATRSPVRPNRIGLSAVELISIDRAAGRLTVAGIDLADNTAIIDIKPYVPYSDSIPDAHGGFAHARPDDHLEVRFNEASEAQLRASDPALSLRALLTESLTQDPRPAYQKDDPERLYHLKIAGYEAGFRVHGGIAWVEALTRIDGKGRG